MSNLVVGLEPIRAYRVPRQLIQSLLTRETEMIRLKRTT
jgi:hypothetical protein